MPSKIAENLNDHIGRDRPSGNAAFPLGPENVHSRFAAENHAYLTDMVHLADQKAAFFFAASAAVIYVLFNDGVEKHWPQCFHDFRHAVGLLAMVVSALACAFAIAVYMPRRWARSAGWVFFGAIAGFGSRDSYADEVLKTPDVELIREKLMNCHDLARVCSVKYRRLIIQLWIMIAGLILATIYYVSS